MVRYLAQSSVGAEYIGWKLSEEGGVSDKARETELAKLLGFDFYLAKPDAATIREFDLEGYRIVDPCMGAGHILVYTLEMLVRIYENEGVPPSVSARKIIESNLFGLDIDPTVSDLAAFSLLMRAAEYDGSILVRPPKMNLAAVYDGEWLSDSEISALASSDPGLLTDIKALCRAMSGGSEYGSLIRLDRDKVDAVLSKMSKIPTWGEPYNKLVGLVRCAELLSGEYDAVITNPPYMGKKNLNARLSDYLDKKYAEGKGELYSAFILRCLDMAKDGGAVAMITVHSWMFISSFSKLRKRVLDSAKIETLVHSGAGTFEELNAFNVLASAFCLRKGRDDGTKSRFLNLSDLYRPGEKTANFHNTGRYFDLSDREFLSIPGASFAYRLSERQRRSFAECRRLGDYVFPRVGLQTGDNDRFVRYWFEVAREDIAIGCKDADAARKTKKRWVPYNKGGNFRKWYGMNEYVVDFTDGGELVYSSAGSAPNNRDFYFKEGITWSLFGFENFGVRYKEAGFVFDVSGASVFPSDADRMYILAFLSSSVAFSYLSVLAPTVNFQAGNIADLPIIIDEERRDEISALASDCVRICRMDWNEMEESWDFTRHPLCEYKDSLDLAYPLWEARCLERYTALKSNEERINTLFAEIYGILDTHNVTVCPRDMSVKPAELKRDMVRLISYAVGCVFGRFEWRSGVEYPSVIDPSELAKRVEGVLSGLIRNGGYAFLVSALGDYANIEQYLARGFFDDHARLYKKRPIYWQVDSGKSGAFRALVYCHALGSESFSQILRMAEKRRCEITLLRESKTRAASLAEIDGFIEKIRAYIDTPPTLDLNDGVLTNREKISNILKKVK